jgi:hypothetical protein
MKSQDLDMTRYIYLIGSKVEGHASWNKILPGSTKRVSDHNYLKGHLLLPKHCKQMKGHMEFEFGCIEQQ